MITAASIVALAVAGLLLLVAALVRELAPESHRYSPLRRLARWAEPACVAVTVVAVALTMARIIVVAG